MNKLIAALIIFAAFISTPVLAQAVDLDKADPENYIVMDVD